MLPPASAWTDTFADQYVFSHVHALAEIACSHNAGAQSRRIDWEADQHPGREAID